MFILMSICPIQTHYKVAALIQDEIKSVWSKFKEVFPGSRPTFELLHPNITEWQQPETKCHVEVVIPEEN